MRCSPLSWYWRIVAAAVIFCAGPTQAELSVREGQLVDAAGNAITLKVSSGFLFMDHMRSATSGAAIADAAAGLKSLADVNASLSAPDKVELPRTGGMTTVALQASGLGLKIAFSSLPEGMSAELNGSDLTITSSGNGGPDAKFGSVGIYGEGLEDKRGPRAAVGIVIGLMQRPCHPLPCAPASMTSSLTKTRQVSEGIDWVGLQVAMQVRARPGLNSVVVVLNDSDSTSRTSGEDITRVLRLCRQNGRLCVLALDPLRNMGMGPERHTRYFLSPDVSDALKGQSDQAIISIADAPSSVALSGIVSQLRAAGLTHTLLVNASAAETGEFQLRRDADAILQADSIHNTLFVFPEEAMLTNLRAPAVHIGVPIARPSEVVNTNSEIGVDINGKMIGTKGPLILADFKGGTIDVDVDLDKDLTLELQPLDDLSKRVVKPTLDGRKVTLKILESTEGRDAVVFVIGRSASAPDGTAKFAIKILQRR